MQSSSGFKYGAMRECHAIPSMGKAHAAAMTIRLSAIPEEAWVKELWRVW
jgi:hypothetical protein